MKSHEAFDQISDNLVGFKRGDISVAGLFDPTYFGGQNSPYFNDVVEFVSKEFAEIEKRICDMRWLIDYQHDDDIRARHVLELRKKFEKRTK